MGARYQGRSVMSRVFLLVAAATAMLAAGAGRD
jgi:hypothetical protein